MPPVAVFAFALLAGALLAKLAKQDRASVETRLQQVETELAAAKTSNEDAQALRNERDTLKRELAALKAGETAKPKAKPKPKPSEETETVPPASEPAVPGSVE